VHGVNMVSSTFINIPNDLFVEIAKHLAIEDIHSLLGVCFFHFSLWYSLMLVRKPDMRRYSQALRIAFSMDLCSQRVALSTTSALPVFPKTLRFGSVRA
jgi:hypothetical protein